MRKVYSVESGVYAKILDSYPCYARFQDGKLIAAGFENLHTLPLKRDETIVLKEQGYPFAEAATEAQVDQWLSYASGIPDPGKRDGDFIDA